mmetsp:Transcript_56692/g.123459  ORF Transcript_56692/g.123459 Transcript_56692/m.123459 type:complete len:445 (-) Transcript_56692:1181-2515(-)
MDHRDVEVAEDEVVSPEGVHQSHQEDLLRVVVVLHARLGLVDRLHAAVLHVPVVLVAEEHHRQQAHAEDHLHAEHGGGGPVVHHLDGAVLHRELEGRHLLHEVVDEDDVAAGEVLEDAGVVAHHRAGRVELGEAQVRADAHLVAGRGVVHRRVDVRRHDLHARRSDLREPVKGLVAEDRAHPVLGVDAPGLVGDQERHGVPQALGLRVVLQRHVLAARVGGDRHGVPGRHLHERLPGQLLPQGVAVRVDPGQRRRVQARDVEGLLNLALHDGAVLELLPQVHRVAPEPDRDGRLPRQQLRDDLAADEELRLLQLPQLLEPLVQRAGIELHVDRLQAPSGALGVLRIQVHRAGDHRVDHGEERLGDAVEALAEGARDVHEARGDDGLADGLHGGDHAVHLNALVGHLGEEDRRSDDRVRRGRDELWIGDLRDSRVHQVCQQGVSG